MIAWRAGLLSLVFLVWSTSGLAQVAAESQSALASWLSRVHLASRQSVYTGTIVVSSANSFISARIWHVCEGNQQLERVEMLSGVPRAIFRHNDQVVTFFPQTRTAVAESRESLGLFPELLKLSDASLDQFYQLKELGQDRIAGFETDVVHLVPKDRLRYGYRIWSERRTGLILRLQTLDLQGRILEQAAFSELQLDAALSASKLLRSGSMEGYRVIRADVQRTTPEAQGWVMRREVDGFKRVNCYQRPVVSAPGEMGALTMQCLFGDGVATVSLFAEVFDPRRHMREGETDLGGATRSLSRRVQNWWLTAMGEVPSGTLAAFANSMERNR